MMDEVGLVETWIGTKVKDMSLEEFTRGLAKVLAEVVFITGGKMYDKNKADQKKFYDLQLQTISKFIITTFSFFTLAEISKAFYLNAAGKFSEIYSHYNREINIEFVGKVLAGYKEYKQGLFNVHGEKLYNAIHPPKQLPPAKVLTDEDYLNDKRLMIEQAYQNLITNLDMNDELFPAFFYDTLEADGAFPVGLYQKKMKEAKERIAHNEQVKIMYAQMQEHKDGEKRYHDTVHISAALETVRRMVKAGKIEELHPVRLVSKQMIVKEYFLKLYSAGRKNIYAVEKAEKAE